MTVQPASRTAIQGILLIIGATFIFACQDAITKHLAQTYATPQIVWVRYLFFAVFAMALSGWNKPLKQVVKARRPSLQILRSVIIVVEMGIFVLAIRVMGLAEVHSIFACAPLIVTAMSSIFLQEQVGIRRWGAVFVGFIGILIILRPGTGAFQPEALWALLAAAMFATYQILTRVTSQEDSTNTSMLYMAVIGAAILCFVGPFYWIEPTPEAWRWLALLSLTGATSHLMLIKALELAPASVLQPFNFTQLVWATLVGFVVFDAMPTGWTIVGAGIVVASGLYTLYRERERNVPEPTTEAQVKP